MPDETQQTQSIDTSEVVPVAGVMETPIVIEPVAETPVEREVAPAQPAAPVTPAAATKTFAEKLEDYMHGRSDVDPTEEAAKPAGTEEEPEPAKAPVAEAVPQATTSTIAAPKPAAAPARVVKDYTGLAPDEVHISKNMSNEAYAKVRPIFDAHKKIAEREAQLKAREESVGKALPKGVFDHEQAYTLAPQFNQLATTVQQLEFERGYWAKQFAKIESGEEYTELQQDPKSGRIFESKPLRPTPEAKAEVMQRMTLATQLHSQHQQQLQQVQQSFTQRRAELLGGVKSIQKKLFGFIDTEGNPYKPIVQEALNAVPEEFRDHPMSEFAAYAMATIRAQADQNAKLAKQLAARQTAAADVRKAGPTMTRTNAAVSGTRPATQELDYSKMTPEQVIASFKQS